MTIVDEHHVHHGPPAQYVPGTLFVFNAFRKLSSTVNHRASLWGTPYSPTYPLTPCDESHWIKGDTRSTPIVG